VSGARIGMHRGMDRFGLCPVGPVTAVSGGTVRDMLSGHSRLAWISHPDYVLITITTAAGATAGRKWLRNLQGRAGGLTLRMLAARFAGNSRSSPPPIRAAHTNPHTPSVCAAV